MLKNAWVDLGSAKEANFAKGRGFNREGGGACFWSPPLKFSVGIKRGRVYENGEILTMAPSLILIFRYLQ